MADDANRPAVEERGELSLLLDGTMMVLRPTFEAIQSIEGTLGRGLVDLARDAIAGKLSLADTAQIATECIRAFGRDTDDKNLAGAGAPKIARLIYDAQGGLHSVQKTVSAMLSLAVTGGYTSSGELKPSATTTTETAKAPADG